MTSVTLQKNTTGVNYTYGSDGTRLTKTVNGVQTSYTWDGSQLVSQKTGNEAIYFLYHGSSRVGLEYQGSTYYYLYNLQGDVVGLVDSNGSTVVSYTYDAWGHPESTTGSMASTLGAANPFRYRSYYFDTESGLYYLMSRYYDGYVVGTTTRLVRFERIKMLNILVGNAKDEDIVRNMHPQHTELMCGDGYLIVAKEDHRIIGFAWAFKRMIPAPVGELLESFINVIAVIDSFQNKGIGSLILKKCIEKAKKDQCYQVRAYCDIGNVISHKLWVKNSFGISPVSINGNIVGSFVTYKL